MLFCPLHFSVPGALLAALITEGSRWGGVRWAESEGREGITIINVHVHVAAQCRIQ